MSKRIFQILDEMNVSDEKNKSETVAVSKYLLAADKIKQGGKITMGVDTTRFNQIANQMFSGSQDKIVLLLVIDRAEYEKIENQK